MELLAELGLLGPRFTAVHAVHVTEAEARTWAKERHARSALVFSPEANDYLPL